MHIIAQTPRFVIREFNPEEEAIYLALFDDPRVTLHLPIKSHEQHIREFNETLKKYTEDDPLSCWGIFNVIDEDFIGICLLTYNPEEKNEIEMGYVLHSKYWGKGIATDIAQIMVDHSVKNLDIPEIRAITTLENIASQRVLEKAGFKRLFNILRDFKNEDGDWCIELACFIIKCQKPI